MTTVLDASVVVKCFVRERGSDEALTALSAAGALVAPDLLFAEVCNVLWKKTRRSEIDAPHAARVLRALSTLFDQVVPTGGLIVRALEIAVALDHPAYDAIYIALAESADAHLVTDDARLVARVRDTQWGGRVRSLRG
ncbi:MAG: ribonuclease VapC [Myxococcales bacterium]